MTPEELAVIQAAIAWLQPPPDPETIGALKQAVQRLIFSCQECNLGGHTCPGDGNPIPHGASDCGDPEHHAPVHAGADGSCPDYGSSLDPCPPGCASGVCVVNQPSALAVAADVCVCSRVKKMYCVATDCHGGEDLLIWVARTWRDVRQGDVVRLPGSETVAGVYTAMPVKWHVDPRTGTSSFNPPKPLEHAIMRVRFAHEDFPRDMDPNKPVEIKLTASEVAALNAAGWMNRVETRKGEPQ